jgi:hypothetical protein
MLYIGIYVRVKLPQPGDEVDGAGYVFSYPKSSQKDMSTNESG